LDCLPRGETAGATFSIEFAKLVVGRPEEPEHVTPRHPASKVPPDEVVEHAPARAFVLAAVRQPRLAFEAPGLEVNMLTCNSEQREQRYGSNRMSSLWRGHLAVSPSNAP
jgi:hypothetical protein